MQKGRPRFSSAASTSPFSTLLTFLILGLSACTGGGGGESVTENTAELPGVRVAESRSSHFVEVEFLAPAPRRKAEDVDRYEIVGPGGTELDVVEASLSATGDSLMLATGPQQEASYQLIIEGAEHSSASVTSGSAEIVTFDGSTLGEARLVSAIALDSTTVIATFNVPINTIGNVDNYRIFVPSAADPRQIVSELQIVSVVSEDGGRRARITTSAQRNFEYTLKVVIVDGSTNGQTDPDLVNPFMNTATFFGIAAQDTDAPQLLGAEPLDALHVLVTFSEPMDQLTLRPEDFLIEDLSGATESPILVEALEVGDFGTRALLSTDVLAAMVEYTLTVTNVTDLNGNPIDPANDQTTFEFGGPGLDLELVRLIGAAARSNSMVAVQFSRPMADNALDPRNYQIFQDSDGNVGDEIPQLPVLGAQFVDPDERLQVTLTTAPQNGVPYVLKVLNVTDLSGEPLAAAVSEFLEAANSASFTGIPPRCGGLCINGVTGLDGLGACTTDSDCDDDPPCQVAVPEADCDGQCGGDGQCGNGQGACTTDSDCDDDPPCEPAPEADCGGQCVTGCDIVDSDGDGLPDNVEISGWDVTVFLANGELVRRRVTSDPFLADTDGDTVSDLDELRELSDPRNLDTDGDQLTDAEEFAIFASLFNMDTDADGIFDGWEFHTFKTNPLVADTDGDDLDDYRELFEMNRNPRIADLPKLSVRLGEVRLLIDERYTFTDERGETATVESSSTATLENETSTGRVSTNFDLTDKTVGGSFTASIDLGFCTPQETSPTAPPCKTPFGSINGEGGAAIILGFEGTVYKEVTTTTGNTVENSSAFTAKQSYERSLTKGSELTRSRSVTREVFGARIDVNLNVLNVSDLAFRAENLEVTMLVTDPEDRTRLLPVATLVPASTLETGEPLVLNLSPGGERGPLIFSSREVIPNLVEDLMRQPRGVLLQVGNVDIVDELGRNLAFVLQQVQERTAAIAIDAGDGKPDVFMVSTNATIDDDGILGTPGAILGGLDNRGLQVGIPLEFLLRDVLKLEKNGTVVDGVIAGANLTADSFAEGDDVQLVPAGTAGVPPSTKIIDAGPNGVIDTRVLAVGLCADGSSCDTDCPESFCDVGGSCHGGPLQGDPCVAPCADDAPCNVGVCVGGSAEGTVCTPGKADTCRSNDGQTPGFCAPRDEAIVTRGYATSNTCSAETSRLIVDGGDGTADTLVPDGTDDVQVADHLATGLVEGEVIVGPGPDGFIETVPGGDDRVVGPGDPCEVDSDCRVAGGPGTCTGRETLVRVGGRKSGHFRRFWATLVAEHLLGAEFDSISLRAGDSLVLAFVQDIDRDGLLAREENKFGSSDTKRDTDDDGLDDFSEIRIGWDVGVIGSDLRQVFPDPRVPDSDFDRLEDGEELSLAALGIAPGRFGLPPDDPISTDPTLADTDRDGVEDWEETFGFLAGAGIFDPLQVITAGDDGVAETRACGGVTCSGGQRIGQPCQLFRNLPDDTSLNPECPDTDVDELCVGGPRDGQPCKVDDCAQGTCTGGVCVGGPSAGMGCAVDDCDAGTCTPGNVCEGGPTAGLPCENNDDCLGILEDGSDAGTCTGSATGFCVAAVEDCDDLQVVAVGTAGLDPFVVVVAPGKDGDLETSEEGDDVRVEMTSDDPPTGDADAGGDDQQVVVSGDPVPAGGVVVRPGPDGVIQSRPGVASDDVVMLGRFAVRTNPLNPDTDFDQVDDGFERRLGSDPSVSDSGEFADQDEDGLTDAEETRIGWKIIVNGGPERTVFSNPFAPDSDLDRLPDLLEKLIGSDPRQKDTDGDGIDDFDEFADFESYLDFNEFFPGFFLDGSTSQRFGTDPSESDTDDDGLSDFDELFKGWPVHRFGQDPVQVFSDPLVPDTDGDGLSDREEAEGADGRLPCALLHFNCPRAGATCSAVNDVSEVDDCERCCFSDPGSPERPFDATDPRDPDTDDDGTTDQQERDAGSNPLVADLRVTVRLVELRPVRGPDLSAFPTAFAATPFQFDIRVRRPLTAETFTVASTFAPHAPPLSPADKLIGIACNPFGECGGCHISFDPVFHYECDLSCIESLGRSSGGILISPGVYFSPACPDRQFPSNEDLVASEVGACAFLSGSFESTACLVTNGDGSVGFGDLCYSPCRSDDDCHASAPYCRSTKLLAVDMETAPLREQFLLMAPPNLNLNTGNAEQAPMFDGSYHRLYEDFSTRDKDLVNLAPPINDLSAQFTAQPGEPFVIEADWRTTTSRLFVAQGVPRCDPIPLRIVRRADRGTFERTEPQLICETPTCMPENPCTVGFVFEIFVNSLADPSGP